METIKLFINEKDQVTFLCPTCSHHETFDASNCKKYSQQVKIRCKCGIYFLASVEKRKYYRRKVNFCGQYFKNNSLKYSKTGDTTILDLPITGVKFQAGANTTLKINDIIKINIHLDDGLRSIITRTATIRDEHDYYFGPEFCDNTECEPLAFYLMP